MLKAQPSWLYMPSSHAACCLRGVQSTVYFPPMPPRLLRPSPRPRTRPQLHLNLLVFSNHLPAVMSYSVSVGKPILGVAPDDAPAKPHHIKAKDGTTTHFQNIHASGKKNFTQWSMPFKMAK